MADDVTRERLIELAQGVAQKLGRNSITRLEFLRETGIVGHYIEKYFDGYRDFCRQAGLEANEQGLPLSNEQLFQAMVDMPIPLPPEIGEKLNQINAMTSIGPTLMCAAQPPDFTDVFAPSPDQKV